MGNYETEFQQIWIAVECDRFKKGAKFPAQSETEPTHCKPQSGTQNQLPRVDFPL